MTTNKENQERASYKRVLGYVNDLRGEQLSLDLTARCLNGRATAYMRDGGLTEHKSFGALHGTYKGAIKRLLGGMKDAGLLKHEAGQLILTPKGSKKLSVKGSKAQAQVPGGGAIDPQQLATIVAEAVQAALAKAGVQGGKVKPRKVTKAPSMPAWVDMSAVELRAAMKAAGLSLRNVDGQMRKGDHIEALEGAFIDAHTPAPKVSTKKAGKVKKTPKTPKGRVPKVPAQVPKDEREAIEATVKALPVKMAVALAQSASVEAKPVYIRALNKRYAKDFSLVIN